MPNDIAQMISMQLLGTVDYDFDKNDDHKLGMSRSGWSSGLPWLAENILVH